MHPHYSDEFLSARKAALESQKQDTEQELHRIARFDESAGSWVALQPEYDGGSSEDIGDSSSEAESLEANQAEVADLEQTLAEVVHALSKFDNDTYGKCETSGDWIEEERLVAYPAAKTCENH